ncbi:MAG TPA: class I tRNA ligase family protein, partial [Clostridia bacterium]|nr:class I tRNA ligase family protein [Clostridia bacterium]
FLYDCGIVPTSEPYAKRTSHGMILGENNEKMSKSRGNVINPDDVVNELGADTLRMYEMFIGDFEKSVPWSQDGVRGCRRFLERVWRLQEILVDSDNITDKLETNIHKTIKKVSEDYDHMKFNTAIASMMTLVNDIYDHGNTTKGDMKILLTLLNPVSPHITEELWQILGFEGMLNEAAWPAWDEAKTIDEIVEIAIQINGKVRGQMMISADSTAEQVKEQFEGDEKLVGFVEGKQIIKEIYVPGRIYNVVVK